MIPFTCPCCEVLQPPHEGDCTFHADAPGDAATFDEVSALRAEIARLREERRWVPVGERLPKDNDLVLTVGKGGWIVIGDMTKSCGWQSIHCDNETGEPWISDPGDVTHWMPLPPGPEGDG